MFNPFGKKSQSVSTLEAPVCQMEVTYSGLIVSGPREGTKIPVKPNYLEDALWQYRAQLVESGLVDLSDRAEEEPSEIPIEVWETILIPYESLVYLKEGFATALGLEQDIEVFDPIISNLLPPLTDWSLKIEPDTNVLVSEDLSLDISFWGLGQEMHPRRFGPWLITYGQASLLNQTQWNLCQIVEQFNSLETKGQEANFAALAQLYEQLGEKTTQNVQLEAILEDTVILAPSRITMGWQQDSDRPNATQSAYPILLNIPVEDETQGKELEEAFRHEFFKYDKAQPAYSLPALSLASDGPAKRIRVLLTPSLQDAATQMRRSLRGLNKTAAQAIALAPYEEFEGVCPPDVLAFDLTTYGPRVVGMGPLVFRPILKVRTLDRVCLLEDGWDRLIGEDQPDNPTVLEFEAQNGAGESVKLYFSKDPATLEALSKQVNEALQKGEPLVTINDATGNEATFTPTPQLASAFQKAVTGVKAASSKQYARSSQPVVSNTHDRHLSTLSNEEQKLYDELMLHQQDQRPMLERFDRPYALVDTLSDGKPLELAHYQQEGIAWLQTAFLSGKPGVLLADDMGLGKTLQVLTFLAWLIESGWGKWQDAAKSPHWATSPIATELKPGQQFIVNPHPILVVVPKMLMHNWEDEINKFFKQDGDIFSNFAFLDSKEIKNYALPNLKKSNDFKTGEPSLNLQLLMSNRLIVANYDTVKNYYHSFAKVSWACLVMDESQEIKNPGTAVTHAMSCIATNTRFKVTMTGTPIENDLMDLWTLFDIAAPGLLGSAKEFKQNYFLAEKATTSHGWELERLKETLGCKTLLKEAQPTSYVLGRNKKDYLGGELPPIADVTEVEANGTWPEKVEPFDITCRFRYTSLEWQQQREILEEIAKESKRGRALKAVQYIKAFSEHPWLACVGEEPRDRVYDTENLLQSSSKFRWLLETIKLIQKRNEKVLIFTRSVQMQTWINNMLKERYGFDFQPINGAISSKKEAGSSLTKAILKRFEGHPGFAALVLSPEVAGVGLNITAANHVIHYGRWWNPAKEDQATCRAYRKGQKRPVYLYVPIGEGPNGEHGFDERLDSMLRSKSIMRHDFLTPTVGLELSPDDTAVLIPGFEDSSIRAAQAEGHEFENIVAQWMKANGFEQVQVTPATGDWGSDILAVKDNLFYLVQCKRQLKASDDIIEDINQAKTYYGSNGSYSSYSKGRKMLAVVASRYNVSDVIKNYFMGRNIEVWQEKW